MSFVIIQHDKARSASDRPATRDAQHPESGVLNSYCHFIITIQGFSWIITFYSAFSSSSLFLRAAAMTASIS
jgi:hypothetical protein